MMGRHEKQNELWADPVNLAKRIPEDHSLRQVHRVLKLDFVRQEVAPFYGKNGQVSIDPVLLMKMMLLLFLDNIKSERELMKIIPLRIDYLWFLGYGLEDEIPHHSVLSKARKRWGSEVFARLFAQSVGQCIDAGLVEGSKLHCDSSLVTAHASRNSIIQSVVDEQMAKLEADNDDPDPPSSPTSTAKVNRRHTSTTDPDSTVVRQSVSGKPTPSYKVHRGIDDKAGVITAVITTTGIVDEAHRLEALIEQHQELTQQKVRTAVADCKYGNTANFIALAQRNIRSHMGDLRAKLRNPRQEGIYPASRFAYDARRDVYTCPAGRLLRRHHFVAARGYFEYRTASGICARCKLRSLCTRAKAGRTLKRYQNQELLDKARRQSHSRQGWLDRKRRQHLQEGNFADAANHHGFKRARWRGLQRQSIQDLIISTLQNLRKLARRLAQGPSQPLSALKSLCQQLFRRLYPFWQPRSFMPQWS